MSITQILVTFAIIIFIGIGSGVLGIFFGWMLDDDDMIIFIPWALTSIGFGICLTIVLYQNGIFK